MYYELKLKVNKTNDKGEEKEVKEHFITDCELFAEAEAKGLEQYHPTIWNAIFSLYHAQIL
jgi:hypothetical protein